MNNIIKIEKHNGNTEVLVDVNNVPHIAEFMANLGIFEGQTKMITPKILTDLRYSIEYYLKDIKDIVNDDENLKGHCITSKMFDNYYQAYLSIMDAQDNIQVTRNFGEKIYYTSK